MGAGARINRLSTQNSEETPRNAQVGEFSRHADVDKLGPASVSETAARRPRIQAQLCLVPLVGRRLELEHRTGRALCGRCSRFGLARGAAVGCRERTSCQLRARRGLPQSAMPRARAYSCASPRAEVLVGHVRGPTTCRAATSRGPFHGGLTPCADQRGPRAEPAVLHRPCSSRGPRFADPPPGRSTSPGASRGAMSSFAVLPGWDTPARGARR